MLALLKLLYVVGHVLTTCVMLGLAWSTYNNAYHIVVHSLLLLLATSTKIGTVPLLTRVRPIASYFDNCSRRSNVTMFLVDKAVRSWHGIRLNSYWAVVLVLKNRRKNTLLIQDPTIQTTLGIFTYVFTRHVDPGTPSSLISHFVSVTFSFSFIYIVLSLCHCGST